MAQQPEIHWSEGMFLRPQHLQLFARQVSGLVADTWRLHQPFFWGLVALEVAEDQLESFTLALARCEAVLKDGSRLLLPATMEVTPRGFKDALDAAGGELTVFLGVPLRREGEPNAVAYGEEAEREDLRWAVSVVEASDENLGGPPQRVEVRKLNGRLFFGDESQEGYATLPVALVQRAGYGSNTPVLAREFIPPLLNAWGWAPLARMVQGVLKRVEAKHRFLQAEITEGRLNLDTSGLAAWQPLFKLQIVGSFMHVLRQLVGIPGVHPFDVYLELARLAGELAIFEERGAEALQVPLYDHDNLGACFNTLVYTVEQLLEKIISGRFIRVDFELEDELLVAQLQAEWLGEDSELFLCVDSDLSDRQILTRLETAKIGAPNDIQLLKQRRLFGLDIELLRRTPGGLPSRENLHYFSIAREGIYWEEVGRRRAIAISGGIDPKLRFSLYVIRGPQRGLGDEPE